MAKPVPTRMSPVHLNRYHHWTQLLREPGLKFRTEILTATDGAKLPLLTIEPASAAPTRTLLFYHGMDGDCGDAAILWKYALYAGLRVLCYGGRGPSWVADTLLADTMLVLDRSCGVAENVELGGVSMGATQALYLAAALPPEWQERMTTAIALIPCTDLPDAAARSSVQEVRTSLLRSVGGNPEMLRRRSPHALLEKLPAGAKYFILANIADNILPADPTLRFAEALRRRAAVALGRANGEHDFTYADFDFARLDRMLGTNDEATWPSPTEEWLAAKTANP